MTGGLNNMIMRPNLPASPNQNQGYRGGKQRNQSGKFLLCSVLPLILLLKFIFF
jgi:hypothetical protein